MPDSELPPGTWRLLNSGYADGPTNMAVDEAILMAVAAGQVSPTLRFYGWQPACLSLGYGQPGSDADLERLHHLGWDLVRRPTGGRAILHVDELTYSVTAPMTEPRVVGSVLESYERLSQGLMAGLQRLGLQPERARPASGERQGEVGPACFDGPAAYEIMDSGRKLIGSAQVRKQGVVLQHGSLPLYGDIGRIAEALYFETPGGRASLYQRMHFRATTLLAALGRAISLEEAAEAMIAGFSETLNLRLEPGELTSAEIQFAARLRAEKYGNDVWMLREKPKESKVLS